MQDFERSYVDLDSGKMVFAQFRVPMNPPIVHPIIRPFRWMFSRCLDMVPMFGNPETAHIEGHWRNRWDDAVCRWLEEIPPSWQDQND